MSRLSILINRPKARLPMRRSLILLGAMVGLVVVSEVQTKKK
jgi:hypothetical protein